ncbi:MAG: histidine phosphatase family protein [Anaerolineales bacterium]|nr:histidine phosphatase family protein [Anaerolineales bacterium]
MSNVWFIRHGESISNANLPTGDPAESSLTEKGFAEAERIVGAFVDKPDLIVVSPYLRARQTAVPTITHFSPIAVEEWPVFEFTYLHPQRYNGTRGSERGPFAQAYWQRNDPHEKEMGGGESFTELMTRIQQLIDRLHQHPADTIAVFSHGLFLRGLLWMLITGIRAPTKDAMRRYHHFVQGVLMPNGAILKTTFNGRHSVTFGGFETGHME